MKFIDYPFSPEIQRGLQEAGFVKPTDIQFRAIPPILRGEDVFAIAQTGTGKTAAFALPVLNMLHKSHGKKRGSGVKCLIMVPTRELGKQLESVFIALGRYTPLSFLGIFGGAGIERQIEKLNLGVDVLISTPGRMFDLINRGNLLLHRAEILILDEADRMLDMGFYKDIKAVLPMLKSRRQTLFFSATLNPKIKKLAYDIVRNPIRISVSPRDPVNANIDHALLFAEMDEKRFVLQKFLESHPGEKILIFARTKVRVERVQKFLMGKNFPCVGLHGGMEQKTRNFNLKKFRSGEEKILVATDVSARGIDIPDIDWVINYDLPDDPRVYVHRVGRTGRGTKRGKALSFCSPGEKPLMGEIEKFTGKKIQRISLSREELDSLSETKTGEEGDWKKLIAENEKRKKK